MTRSGGFSGKARIARDRARDDEWFSQRMITDAVEPNLFTSTPPRHIKVGHRSEFLPSFEDAGAAPSSVAVADPPSNPANRAATPKREGDVAEDDPDGCIAEAAEATPEAVPVIRPVRRMPQEPLFPMQRQARQRFSVARFGAGCAVGVGVALVLLTALRALLG